MGTYLFDSDILINHLRGKHHIREYLDPLEAGDNLCCSVISLAEIHAGMRTGEEKRTHELLESLVHIPITKEIAIKAGEIRRNLGRSGRDACLDDCLIAATAALVEATLITLNRKHYPTLTKILPLA